MEVNDDNLFEVLTSAPPPAANIGHSAERGFESEEEEPEYEYASDLMPPSYVVPAEYGGQPPQETSYSARSGEAAAEPSAAARASSGVAGGRGVSASSSGGPRPAPTADYSATLAIIEQDIANAQSALSRRIVAREERGDPKANAGSRRSSLDASAAEMTEMSSSGGGSAAAAPTGAAPAASGMSDARRREILAKLAAERSERRGFSSDREVAAMAAVATAAPVVEEPPPPKPGAASIAASIESAASSAVAAALAKALATGPGAAPPASPPPAPAAPPAPAPAPATAAPRFVHVPNATARPGEDRQALIARLLREKAERDAARALAAAFTDDSSSSASEGGQGSQKQPSPAKAGGGGLAVAGDAVSARASSIRAAALAASSTAAAAPEPAPTTPTRSSRLMTPAATRAAALIASVTSTAKGAAGGDAPETLKKLRAQAGLARPAVPAVTAAATAAASPRAARAAAAAAATAAKAPVRSPPAAARPAVAAPAPAPAPVPVPVPSPKEKKPQSQQQPKPAPTTTALTVEVTPLSPPAAASGGFKRAGFRELVREQEARTMQECSFKPAAATTAAVAPPPAPAPAAAAKAAASSFFSSLAAGAAGGMSREQRLSNLSRPRTAEVEARERRRREAEDAAFQATCTFQPNSGRSASRSRSRSHSVKPAAAPAPVEPSRKEPDLFNPYDDTAVAQPEVLLAPQAANWGTYMVQASGGVAAGTATTASTSRPVVPAAVPAATVLLDMDAGRLYPTAVQEAEARSTGAPSQAQKQAAAEDEMERALADRWSSSLAFRYLETSNTAALLRQGQEEQRAATTRRGRTAREQQPASVASPSPAPKQEARQATPPQPALAPAAAAAAVAPAAPAMPPRPPVAPAPAPAPAAPAPAPAPVPAVVNRLYAEADRRALARAKAKADAEAAEAAACTFRPAIKTHVPPPPVPVNENEAPVTGRSASAGRMSGPRHYQAFKARREAGEDWEGMFQEGGDGASSVAASAAQPRASGATATAAASQPRVPLHERVDALQRAKAAALAKKRLEAAAAERDLTFKPKINPLSAKIAANRALMTETDEALAATARSGTGLGILPPERAEAEAWRTASARESDRLSTDPRERDLRRRGSVGGNSGIEEEGGAWGPDHRYDEPVLGAPKPSVAAEAATQRLMKEAAAAAARRKARLEEAARAEAARFTFAPRINAVSEKLIAAKLKRVGAAMDVDTELEGTPGASGWSGEEDGGEAGEETQQQQQQHQSKPSALQSFLTRQTVMQRLAAQSQMRRRAELQAASECTFRPNIGNAEEVLAHARPELVTESAEERVKRLAEGDKAAVDASRARAHEEYYSQFTYKPALAPGSRAIGRAHSLEEHYRDEEAARARLKAAALAEEAFKAKHTFKPQINTGLPGVVKERLRARSKERQAAGEQPGEGDEEVVAVPSRLGIASDPEHLSARIEALQREREEKLERARRMKEYEELKACTFHPEVKPESGAAAGGEKDVVVVRGLGRFLELKELSKKIDEDKKEREAQAFVVKGVSSETAYLEPGAPKPPTVPAPFKLASDARAVKNAAIREAEEAAAAAAAASAAARVRAREVLASGASTFAPSAEASAYPRPSWARSAAAASTATTTPGTATTASSGAAGATRKSRRELLEELLDAEEHLLASAAAVQ